MAKKGNGRKGDRSLSPSETQAVQKALQERIDSLLVLMSDLGADKISLGEFKQRMKALK